MNKFQLLLIIAISVICGYFVGVNKVSVDWKHYKPRLQVINKEPPASLSTVDLMPFWAVWNKVNTLYYDKKIIDPQKMLNGAIQGLVSSIGDPYTMYLPPVQNKNFNQQLAGQFEGIGAELGLKDKAIIIVAPLEGSPAQKAGIKVGDLVLKVDGQKTDGWTLPQAVEKIRGPKGTQVVLTVQHKDDQKIVDVSITRDTITVKSVLGWVKPVKDVEAIKLCHDNATQDAICQDNIMYIRLSQFGDATNQDWMSIVGGLIPQASQVKGVILDLRSNPGGYLSDAQFVAGEFLKQGSPVVIQDPGNGQQTTLSVERAGQLVQPPLIVLINGGSASASEIVAGALRDNERAQLVGDQSFGKGTIQTALDLGEGAGLHVTIARWLTPKGTWVSDPNHKGLTPDVKVALDPNDAAHDTQLEKAIQLLVQ